MPLSARLCVAMALAACGDDGGKKALVPDAGEVDVIFEDAPPIDTGSPPEDFVAPGPNVLGYEASMVGSNGCLPTTRASTSRREITWR